MIHSKVKLGNAAILITKGTTPTTVGFQFTDVGIPFLRAEDVIGGFVDVENTGKRINEECHKALERSQLKPRDLLITIAGSVGRVGIVPDDANPANCNQAVCVVRLKDDIFDLQFLLFYLRSNGVQQQFRQQGTTATITNVSLAQIRNIDVPLLPISEQRNIVDLLSRAEGIVRMRRKAQRKSAELIPAMFLEMFGDPTSNPKGWPALRIDDLVERFEGGKNIQAGDDEAAAYRILKISAVTSGRYIETESKPAPDNLAPPESHFVRAGDLLISRANTEALVGATALVETTNGKTLLPDKLWRVMWRNSASIESHYALYLLQQPSVRAKLSQLASGTGGSMKNISQAKLKELPLPVPPIELQREFVTKVEAVQSIIFQQTAALAKAQAAFDALLQRMFAP